MIAPAAAVGLEDPLLLRDQCWIGGVWQAADSGDVDAVHDPATGVLIAQVPRCRSAEASRAVSAAMAALPAWSGLPALDRADALRSWAGQLRRNAPDLARLLTLEQGKPLAEAHGEILQGAAYMEWCAEEGRRLYGEIIPSHRPDMRLLVLRQAVGVVAAITPWNFPCSMIARKAAAALAAGCTVVCKPAPQTPLTALAMAELAARVGLPPGVFNVVTGDAPSIGEVFCSHPGVRKLSFTGSTPVGRHLAQRCAAAGKRVALELGGNAPFIVFDDADLGAAVEGAMQAKFRNSGQTCVCANRILVQSSVHDEFVSRLAAAVSSLQVGPGLQAGSVQGPLIDSRALERVEATVQAAVDGGARCLVGGRRHPLGGTFYEPTLLVDMRPEMDAARTELFGPVAPVLRFEDEREAVALANDTESGLAAYCYSRDLARCWRMIEALEYGMVGLNTGLITTESAPFGGIKGSGQGREGSRHGVLDYTELKYACVGGLG